MHPLKTLGQNVVPVGYYSDPEAREKGLTTWLECSLFPFFKNLEKSIIDEFKLIPQMLSYNICLGGEWSKELSSLTTLEEIIEAYVRKNGPDPFLLQIVILCTHPHIDWETVLDIAFEKQDQEYDGELYDCYGFMIESVWLNLDEQMTLASALLLIENVLVELRINYVQNS